MALSAFSHADTVVLDHYDLAPDWERAVKSTGKCLVVIDDFSQRQHICDIYLDQNECIGPNGVYLGVEPTASVRLLGPNYALVRPEFVECREMRKARASVPSSVLIFLSGSDPDDITSKVLEGMALITCQSNPSLLLLDRITCKFRKLENY